MALSANGALCKWCSLHYGIHAILHLPQSRACPVKNFVAGLAHALQAWQFGRCLSPNCIETEFDLTMQMLSPILLDLHGQVTQPGQFFRRHHARH